MSQQSLQKVMAQRLVMRGTGAMGDMNGTGGMSRIGGMNNMNDMGDMGLGAMGMMNGEHIVLWPPGRSGC